MHRVVRGRPLADRACRNGRVEGVVGRLYLDRQFPTIAPQLHAGVALILGIMMGYTVMITAMLLPYGCLADLHGRVRIYAYGFVIFTVSSALCGVAPTGAILLVGLLIQGVGAAFQWSNSTAILTEHMPKLARLCSRH